MAVPVPEAIALEEELAELVLPGFTHDDAWRLGSLARGFAADEGLGVAIRVTRGTQIAFQGTTAGSSADNDDWMSRKIRLVERLNIASLTARLSGSFGWLDDSYARAGGCIPLRVAGGAQVGTLTVSGLADTEDHALAIRALKALLAG
jgi:uncharacterized protein (UPF0303 family)